MRNDFYKILWLLRFEKIKAAEENAAFKYQRILDVCLSEFGEEHEAIRLLEQLVREERAHAHLADELLRICERSHPECEGVR